MIKDIKGRNVFELETPKGSSLLFDLSKTKVYCSETRFMASSANVEVSLKAKWPSLPKGQSIAVPEGKVRVMRVEQSDYGETK